MFGPFLSEVASGLDCSTVSHSPKAASCFVRTGAKAIHLWNINLGLRYRTDTTRHLACSALEMLCSLGIKCKAGTYTLTAVCAMGSLTVTAAKFTLSTWTRLECWFLLPCSRKQHPRADKAPQQHHSAQGVSD